MTDTTNKPQRKQNVKFMLAYCRKYIPGFAAMHDRAKASRSGVMPIGGKVKGK